MATPLWNNLSEARDTGVQLSTRSMNLLAMQSRSEQDAFINSQKNPASRAADRRHMHGDAEQKHAE